jgi:hypothetical protein
MHNFDTLKIMLKVAKQFEYDPEVLPPQKSMDFLAEYIFECLDAERDACAKMVEPLDKSLADKIRARSKR